MLQRCAWRLFLPVLAALFLAGHAHHAVAETVAVRSATHDGYGRMVFNWKSPVRFSAGIKDGRLEVRFGRTIDASYTQVVKALGKYLNRAIPGKDGRSVSFALRGGFGLRSFDLGNAVVIDILDDPAATLPQVDSRALTAGQVPLVPVRSGEHEGYTRIVFDWRVKVPYRLRRTGQETTIEFGRAGRVNLAPMKAKPPKYVQNPRSKLTEEGLEVIFTVPETARVRHFLVGSKVVIDIMTPAMVEAAPSTSLAPSASLVPSVKPSRASSQASKTALAPKAAQVPKANRPGLPTRLVPPALQKTAPTSAPTRASIPGQSGGKSTPSLLASAVPSAPTPSKPMASAANGSDEAVTDAKAADRGKGVADGSSEDGEAEIIVQTPAPLVEAITLRFDWDEPVAAAVFRRAGYLWAVFDKSVDLDMEALRAAGGNAIYKIERIAARRATAIRMKTIAGVNPRLRRDGLSWLLEFRQQILAPETTIDTTPEPQSPVGSRLFLQVTEPGNIIALHDPEVGDNLIVVPVIPLGYGVNLTYQYPQVSILPSGQGVVIKPHIDDLRVRPLPKGVEITSGAGLQVTAVSEELLANTRLAPPRPLSRIFDMEKWRRKDLGSFTDNKQKIQRRLISAKKKDLNKVRMDLARFYFANGFAPEALGVLKIVVDSQPNMLGDSQFRALRGASLFLMNRLEEAEKDLSHSSLAGNDEIIFWRAAVRATSSDLAGAAPDLRRTGGITRPYPRALKIPLGSLIAESAVEVGDTLLAARYLDMLNMIKPSRAQRDRLNFIEGRLKELSGEFDGAIKTWERVQKGPHRPSRAKAGVARAELLYKLNKISRSEIIEELEKLRFSWRGDKFEFMLLRRLGQLYIEEGNYRDGLRTLKQAATHFRTYSEAPVVTQTMAKAFGELYLDGNADAYSPVTAIALYEDFKELTPAGPKGDEMIRKLADRLVSVDLLDRAAALLSNQVNFRLKGADRSRVAARLALVYILDRRFDEAVQTIKDTDVPDLPKELADQRRHLLGRALVGLDRVEEALTLLAEDRSNDADLLRVEIRWRGKEWKKAAEVLGRVVSAMDVVSGKPLEKSQARHILDLAVALTLSGDETALDQLRDTHGGAMKKSLFKDAFALIAAPQTEGLIDYRRVAEKASEVENFQSFMTAYRAQLRSKNLSAIN